MRAARIPLVLLLVGGATVIGLRARYGAYGDYYHVTAEFPRATQLMRAGADVRESGVLVGTVSAMRLAGPNRVELTLEIERRYRVPASARAFVDLKTLLGDKFVDLRFQRFGPPFLEDGDRIPGDVGPELEDVVQAGVDVLEAVDPGDLATVVGELAQGARGRGDDIARGLRAGTRLSRIFRKTLPSQLRAVRDFRDIFGELEETGDDLNRLADAVNEGVPVYASEEAQALLRRALVGVGRVAGDLADLFEFQRRDWDRMIAFGDRVLRTIAARPEALRGLVDGLARYVRDLGGTPVPIFDGSGLAAFANFIGGTDFADTIVELCGVLPPPERAHIPICTGGHR